MIAFEPDEDGSGEECRPETLEGSMRPCAAFTFLDAVRARLIGDVSASLDSTIALRVRAEETARVSGDTNGDDRFAFRLATGLPAGELVASLLAAVFLASESGTCRLEAESSGD